MPAAPAPNRPKRLRSLNNPSIGQRPKSGARPPAPKHKCCANPQVEDDGEGHMVCKNCYTQVSESNIVADVSFAEDSRGAATVQGGFVSENARHARSSAAMRRTGGGEKNTLQDIEANGRRALSSLCPKLGILETTMNQALRLYTLAAHNHNFATGRRTDEVIGACLYAACRRQKDNAVLLIDIAELQHINVFRLGEVYKSMCAELYLDPHGGVGTQYLVEVESLIMKYCRRLEFEEATRQVAEDAIKIIRRMKRDWILTGRHPAGLCGAAIILAARMNNFRRSVREVVYVAKVADFTVSRRVEEFRRTTSAALTVDQFREFGVRLKHQHDPPILYESALKKQHFEEKKRKRQAASVARDVIEISDDGSNASSRESSVAVVTPAPDPVVENVPPRKRRRTSKGQLNTPAPTQQEVRRDADGFVIPPLPVDPATGSGEEEQNGKPKKRGRKPQPPEPIVITDEELATEAELEFDINDALNDQEIVDSRNELERAKDEERAKVIAEKQKKGEAEESRSRREAEGVTWLDRNELSSREEITTEELEKAFEDDPEVMNCQLSPAEQTVKEQIWIRENEDWLRLQHEKALQRAIAGANRKPNGKRKNKVVKRRRKGHMGDGTTLAEATTPIETPADASAAMLEVRAPAAYSKWIDYDKLRKVYAPSSSSPSGGASRRSTTPGASHSSRDGTPSSVGSQDGDGRASASPTPAPARSRTVRVQSPPITRPLGGPASAVRRPADRGAPLSPPETQTQASAGAEEQESDDDESGYGQDDLDYGSGVGTPVGWGVGEEDEREDIGEDDYNRAIDPTGRMAVEDTFGEDDF